MDIQDPNFQPPDVTYWPWGIFIGLPLAFAFWVFGRKAAEAFFPRAVLSIAIASALAPTIMNYGDRAFLVHAFAMLRRLFSPNSSERWTGVIAATPPIFIFSIFVFIIWSIIKRRQRHAASYDCR